ncbi:MAG: hypothetical protein VB081_09980 [Christensenella sp.]|uniref:hypothetical protein n=1 Tax=Christensenella sp. TaxID=1935934 RepID=UPI002B1E93A8|nr:hypothetical protein [Christensenella sp.]MEA5003814.1 hypothetical protein [Christensenella sp.]
MKNKTTIDLDQAVENIQKIRSGKKARLSLAEITYCIISLEDAQACLSDDEFQQIQNIFLTFARSTDRKRYVLTDYLDACSRIIKAFEIVAPYEFYDGEDSIKFAQEPAEIKKARQELRQVDKAIQNLNSMVNNAKRDLDGVTENDVLHALKSGHITADDAKSTIDSIRSLQMIISMTPQNIEASQNRKRELMDKINLNGCII